MNANVIVPDLNPCGGGERLALVTMQALAQMGIDFDLTTLKSPDIPMLENAYGKNLGVNNGYKLSETTIKEYFRILKYGYWNLMRNSTIVTNSEFTRKVIVDAFGTDYNSIHILSPPIDVDNFS
jgi:hypothetical protein